LKWKARHNRFSSMNETDFKKFLTMNKKISNVNYPQPTYTTVPPNQYNMITNLTTKSCIHPIRDQGACGGCWSFALTGVLSDRFCLKSKGATNKVFSPQFLLSCDKTNLGCRGGFIDKSWQFVKNYGVVTESCLPFSLNTFNTGKPEKCPSTCVDTRVALTKSLYKISSFGQIKGVTNIMNEIYNNGPVEATLQIYEDFMFYSNGIYSHNTGKLLGNHAIKIVGYGTSTVNNVQTSYWICANSWGITWGNAGYFWIEKGKNESGIEDQVFMGIPKL